MRTDICGKPCLRSHPVGAHSKGGVSGRAMLTGSKTISAHSGLLSSRITSISTPDRRLERSGNPFSSKDVLSRFSDCRDRRRRLIRRETIGFGDKFLYFFSLHDCRLT